MAIAERATIPIRSQSVERDLTSRQIPVDEEIGAHLGERLNLSNDREGADKDDGDDYDVLKGKFT